MKKPFFLLVLSVFFVSCSSTLKVKQIDTQKEKYPTKKTLTEEEILVREKFPELPQYKQFLYVRNMEEVEDYKNYIKGTLENIGYFDKIYYRKDIEQMVINKKLTDKVTNVSDNIGLLNLQKEVGKFLVLDTTVEYKGGYSFVFNFEIIDPSNAKTIYKVKNPAFNWGGLDRPLFNPVFNNYISWINENK